MSKIPKIIHYCWFGKGEKDSLIQRCIESWKNYLPEYTIKEWNEGNFDVNLNTFISQAYNMKKWAFVSDYARLYILYNYGGIYLDTDVEITNSLNFFLDLEGFTCFHSDFEIATGLIGAVKGNQFIKAQLDYYLGKTFIGNNGEMDLKTNIEIFTEISKQRFGFKEGNQQQQILDMTIFPKEYFTIKNINIKNYAIHHFNASWVSHEEMNRQLRQYRQYYQFTVKWLEAIINDKLNLSIYKNKNIGIFGKGYIGELLIDFFRNSNISIAQIIDSKFANDTYQGIPIVCTDSISSQLNLIIITPIHSYERICELLKKKTSAEIMSIEEMISWKK